MLRFTMLVGLTLAACTNSPPPCKGPITTSPPRLQRLTKVSSGSIGMSTRDTDPSAMAGVWAYRFDDAGKALWSKRLYTGPAPMQAPYPIGAIEQQPGKLLFLVGSQLSAFDDMGNSLFTSDVGFADALALFPSTLLQPGAPTGPARIWRTKPTSPNVLSLYEVNADGTLGITHDSPNLGVELTSLQYVPMNGGLIGFTNQKGQTLKLNTVGTLDWRTNFDAAVAVPLSDGFLFGVFPTPGGGGGLNFIKVSNDGTQTTMMSSIPSSESVTPMLLTTTGLAGVVPSTRIATGSNAPLVDIAWYGLDGKRVWSRPSPFELGDVGDIIADGQGGFVVSGWGSIAACSGYPYDDFFQLLQLNAMGAPGWTSKITP
jgi:hypothetical protein